jgi:hypothetical protein
MSRQIDCYIIRDNKPVNISGFVADTLGWTRGNKGIRVSGCGMDMGFHLVYSFAQALFKNGYALKQAWL